MMYKKWLLIGAAALSLPYFCCERKQELPKPDYVEVRVQDTGYILRTGPSLLQVRNMERILSDYTKSRVTAKYDKKSASVRFVGISDSMLGDALTEIDEIPDKILGCGETDPLAWQLRSRKSP